jgi:phosphoribosylcarboxyaminoimidazole (NCAIR) mutase
MAIGKAGAKNAAIFALEILAVSDNKIAQKLAKHKKSMRAKVLKTKIKI